VQEFFFAGLRAGRVLYGTTGILPTVAPRSQQNLKSDALLSVSIGGGSACFVGTDVAMLGNPFRDIFGVLPTDSVLMGCGRAGASTSFGFLALQMGQNLTQPAGKNFLDVNAFAEEELKETSEDELKESSEKTEVSEQLTAAEVHPVVQNTESHPVRVKTPKVEEVVLPSGTAAA